MCIPLHYHYLPRSILIISPTELYYHFRTCSLRNKLCEEQGQNNLSSKHFAYHIIFSFVVKYYKEEKSVFLCNNVKEPWLNFFGCKSDSRITTEVSILKKIFRGIMQPNTNLEISKNTSFKDSCWNAIQNIAEWLF